MVSFDAPAQKISKRREPDVRLETLQLVKVDASGLFGDQALTPVLPMTMINTVLLRLILNNGFGAGFTISQ